MKTKTIRYVVYRRVSTKKQGESGLGLEAQERDIDLYLTNYSDVPYEILNTYTDVKSAKGHTLDSRPVLKAAVEEAERTGATLLVAKLDRLGRSVELIAHLLNRKTLNVRVACMPNADKMQLQIYAVLAEQEREFISLRTKAALKVARDRGKQLGGYRPNAGRKTQDKAEQHRKTFEDLVSEMLESAIPKQRTLQAIADKLNEEGHRTQTGKEFGRMQVKRIVDRMNESA